MRIASLIIILAFLFSLGCAAPIVKGKPIDAAKRAELVKGKTTAKDVTKLLGQPNYVEPLGNGRQKAVYEYYKEVNDNIFFPTSYDKQTLEVYLKKGIVEKYDFTREYRGKVD
jgi:outer membrane protein assembly factor BamE (lipoprotein component of BamABCDE complex)